MGHIAESELRQYLQEAASKVEIGAHYTHYKHPELTYVIRSLIIWEPSDEVAVVYEAEYGERITYARPLAVWLETVPWEGKIVPRFAKVLPAP